MSHQQSFLLLTGCLVLSCFSGARADTIETTETTVHRSTTVSDADVLTLPVTGEYLVLDPISGLPKGRYDPVTRRVDGGVLQAGLVIVDKPTGNLVATVDASGRIVDVSIAPVSDVLMISIDTRQRDLDRHIAEGLNRGQLSAVQAGALRAELDRIIAEEATFRQAGGTLTYRQALVVGYNLNTLAERLGPTAVFTPVISPQLVIQDKRLIMVDAVTHRKLQLLRRIDDEYQAGRLSSDYVSRLKAQLDRVSELDTRSRKRGELSASKSRILSIKLDQLEASLNNDVAVINENGPKSEFAPTR